MTSKTSRIISMAALIIIGIFLIVSPVTMLARAVRIIGTALLVIGILGTIWCVLQKAYTMPLLISFILEIIVGFIFVSSPYAVVRLFPTIAGIVIIANGVMNLLAAMELRGGAGGWKYSAGMAVITILLGLMILMNPFSTMATLVRVIGIIVIYNGISGLMIALQS